MAPPTLPSTIATHSSRFLALPAELRNNIYRLILVQDRVLIRPSGIPEPGLLSTCHQIRAEASSIFWAEDHFGVVLKKFNSDPLLEFEKKALQECRKFKVMTRGVQMRVGQTPNWGNFLVWLKRLHAGEMEARYPVPKVVEPGNGGRTLEQQVLAAVMGMVVEFRGREWKVCEKFVEMQHRALVGIDKLWE